MENIREIVLDTLLALEKGEDFSHRLLKAVLDKYDYLDGRDKAFIKRVTEGTLERRLELDYYLNAFSTVPVKKMKPFIRCLLRMSVFQILYMDAVPDHAVCNEACRLAQKHKFRNLTGFVNGVLRSIAKNKENLPLPDEKKEPVKFLSVKYSMPEWLVEQWKLEYGGEKTVRILEGLLQIHPVSLRFDTQLSETERKAYAEQIRAVCGGEGTVKISQSSCLPYVYLIDKAEGISSLPGFCEGLFTVQDASSALAVEAAGIRQGDFVMDLCAAPGGKSILAAEKAKRVLARDVSESKTLLIEENRRRMRRENIEVQVFDATVMDPAYEKQADVVLMDVPCSGLGVIGKKRDIKYRMTPEEIGKIRLLQRRIVDNSWRYVKPGGILLYSTCTIESGENEEMVRYITEKLPFQPEPIKDCLPKQIWKVWQETLKGRNSTVSLNKEQEACCIQLLPGYFETDGFFFAKFRRFAAE